MIIKTTKHRALVAILPGGEWVGGAEYCDGYWWSYHGAMAEAPIASQRRSSKRSAARWLLLNITGCQVNEICAIHRAGGDK